MARTLSSDVCIEGRWYRRGQSVEQVGEAASRIGDHAWEGAESVAGAASAPPSPAPSSAPVVVPVDVVEDESGDEPEGVTEGSPAVQPAEQPNAQGDESESDEAEPSDEAQAPEPPPQSGRGASEQAWRDYAEQVGVDVGEAEGRAGVIAFIEAAGKPV